VYQVDPAAVARSLLWSPGDARRRAPHAPTRRGRQMRDRLHRLASERRSGEQRAPGWRAALAGSSLPHRL